MKKVVTVIAVLALAMAAAPAPTPHPAPRKHVAPTPTPAMTLPTIARVVSKPFCSALRKTIGPAVAALIKNDAIIASSRPMFEDYLKYEAGGDSNSGMRDLSLMRMENLVTPLVTELAEIDKELNDTSVFRYPPHTADEKRLLDLRDKLQAIEAMDEASLDVINGFVSSEQMAQIQVEGNDTNAAINGDETTMNNQARPTAAPQYAEDPNVIGGLPQNPHTIDPATIPGMELGANPIRHVIQGLQWTQAETLKSEVAAAKPLIEGATLCGGNGAPGPTPAPTSKP